MTERVHAWVWVILLAAGFAVSILLALLSCYLPNLADGAL